MYITYNFDKSQRDITSNISSVAYCNSSFLDLILTVCNDNNGSRLLETFESSYAKTAKKNFVITSRFKKKDRHVGYYFPDVKSINQTLRKKPEPNQLHPGAILENGATSEGGAVFPLTLFRQKQLHL